MGSLANEKYLEAYKDNWTNLSIIKRKSSVLGRNLEGLLP